MSRIGVKPITIPSGVTLQIADDKVTVTGPKGTLTAPLFRKVKVSVEENEVKVTRTSDLPQIRAYHGLVRSMINNHIQGVTAGYKITLKMIGTGYRVTLKGKGISLAVGFSHPVEILPEVGVNLSVEGNDTIFIEGIDKQAVGQMAANIRKVRPPEPYKGKGIRYVDEVVLRKAGKTATK